MIFIKAFTQIFADMSLYMLIGMILTGILSVAIKKQTVARHLGKTSRFAGVKAAAIGVPLPLCSCGVLPTTVYLGQNGASTSAVMSFLISTPQTGVDSIIATFGMMGIVFAVYRPIAAFISGVAGGAIIEKIAGAWKPKTKEAKHKECSVMDCCCPDAGTKLKLSFMQKLKKMARYAFVEFIDDISVHFVAGVAVAALITIIVPTGFFDGLKISSGIPAMLVMLVIGMPMYICSTSSIPIALVLLAKGISPGAAFVFLFAGPATNAASLSVLSKTLGKRTTAVYLAVTAVCAVGFGLLLDAIINWFSLPMPLFSVYIEAQGASVLYTVTAVIFAAVLLRSLISKLIRRIKATKGKNKKEDD